MLEIRTKDLKTRKIALIDGETYTVRTFSNLEQMDIAQYQRRIGQLVELEKKESKVEYSEEAEEISRKLFEIYINLFDDGGDQSKSRKLLSNLSYDEIALILKEVFKKENDD